MCFCLRPDPAVTKARIGPAEVCFRMKNDHYFAMARLVGMLSINTSRMHMVHVARDVHSAHLTRLMSHTRVRGRTSVQTTACVASFFPFGKKSIDRAVD
jgi:hypothetical protein